MIEILGYTTMIIDHIGKAFFEEIIIFQIIGRISLPCFLYLIAKGVKETHSIKKYLLRILFVGIVSQPIFYSIFHQNYLNVCFVLAICGCVLSISNKTTNESYLGFVYITAIVITSIFDVEYGVYAVVIAVMYNYYYGDYLELVILHTFITSITCIIGIVDPIQLYSTFGIVTIVILEMKSPKPLKGFMQIRNKRINYLIYPAHLLIIKCAQLFL